MTSVTFEASMIIDVITRAAKAAPKVSTNSENFSGIVLDVQPQAGYVIVRATNEDVFYREIVEVNEIVGEERTTWRLSSVYLSQIIATFRARSGDEIKFEDNGGLVELTQLRKKAKMGKMKVGNYPAWFDTDPAGAITVTDLGNAMTIVEWAADKSSPALNAVRLTSEAAFATDGYVMVRMPVSLPELTEPVTLQADMFKGLIPQRGDMAMKVIGGTVLFMPNDRTQIRGALIGEKYPNINAVMGKTYEASFTVARDEFTRLIETGRAASDKGKSSVLRLFIGGGVLAGVLEQADDPTTGIRDMIDVSGADHDMHEMVFNPNFLAAAVSHCPDERLTFEYKISSIQFVHIIGSASGYQSWVPPIRPPKEQPSE